MCKYCHGNLRSCLQTYDSLDVILDAIWLLQTSDDTTYNNMQIVFENLVILEKENAGLRCVSHRFFSLTKRNEFLYEQSTNRIIIHSPVENDSCCLCEASLSVGYVPASPPGVCCRLPLAAELARWTVSRMSSCFCPGLVSEADSANFCCSSSSPFSTVPSLACMATRFALGLW